MATELASESIWWFDLNRVNSYLVDDGTVTLIDAGMARHTDALRDELADAGYEAGDVDRILLTHFDIDHVGTLAFLPFEAPIYASEPDASYLEGTEQPALTNRKGLFQRLTDLWLTRPQQAIQRLQDGKQIGGFTAYHTPGHTPGHTSFVHEDLGAAFLGDLVVESDGTLGTPPWFLTYDPEQNRRSIRDLSDRTPDFEIAAMGHGDPVQENGADTLARLADQL